MCYILKKFIAHTLLKMKQKLLLIVCLWVGSILHSQNVQSYSSSPALSIPTSSTRTTTLSVSGPYSTAMNSSWGIYRVRVNISHNSKAYITLKLTSPAGTTCTLVASPASPPIGYRDFRDTYFRDDAPMTMATFYAATTTYRHHTGASWIPATSFSNFNNGQNPTGTWTLTVINSNGTYAATLNSWEIEFRDTPSGDKTTSVWVTNSESGYPSYNDCATPKKIDKYINYYGRTRLTYDENATTDPKVAVAGAPWRLTTEGDVNATIDNTIWYSFQTDATGGTANVYISMISKYSGAGTGYQAVVLDPGSGACVANNWSRVSGSAYVGDNSLGTNPNPLSGPAIGTIILYNSVLKCTGLSANKVYYICIDGVASSGGVATSDVDFQIEVTGNILSNYSVLPVELVDFSGNKETQAVKLNWLTASEKNNDYFTLEKSADGLYFYELNKQKGAGTSLYSKEYSYVDAQPIKGLNYYRLKQTDFDGAYKYSKMIVVPFDQKENIYHSVYPNPSHAQINFDLYSIEKGNLKIEFFDITGRLVNTTIKPIEESYSIISLNIESFTKGIYYMKVYVNDQILPKVEKIIKE